MYRPHPAQFKAGSSHHDDLEDSTSGLRGQGALPHMPVPDARRVHFADE